MFVGNHKYPFIQPLLWDLADQAITKNTVETLIDFQFLHTWYSIFLDWLRNPIKDDVVLLFLGLVWLNNAIKEKKNELSLIQGIVKNAQQDIEMMSENIEAYKQFFYDSLDLKELFNYSLNSDFIATLGHVLNKSPEVWWLVLRGIQLFKFKNHDRLNQELWNIFWKEKATFIRYRKEVVQTAFKKHVVFMSEELRSTLNTLPSKCNKKQMILRVAIEDTLRVAEHQFETMQRINEKNWYTRF